MAHEVSVNLSAIRKALGSQIKALEKAVQVGNTAVKSARAEGKAAKVNANKKNLADAQRVLRTLKRHQTALAAECCDTETQNCSFTYL